MELGRQELLQDLDLALGDQVVVQHAVVQGRALLAVMPRLRGSKATGFSRDASYPHQNKRGARRTRAVRVIGAGETGEGAGEPVRAAGTQRGPEKGKKELDIDVNDNMEGQASKNIATPARTGLPRCRGR